MKKILAMVMAVVMLLALGASAFAAGQGLSLEQAKQAALEYAGVKAAEASFTKAHKDWDDGRAVYEIEFYVGSTEYDMNVDVNTGRITDFSMDYHGGYGRPDSFPSNGYGYGYDDDWDDMFDYDRDLDDMFDYDRDLDDMFDFFD
jgi:hypothetical protein